MIRSLLSVLSSRLHCLCKEMRSLKYGLLPRVALRWVIARDAPPAALRPARWQREAQNTVSVKILRFFSSHRARELKLLLFYFIYFVLFYFIFEVKRAPLLPQKRKAAHLWLLQAFPKKSAMKCWTAGLLLRTSQTEGWEKKISRYWSRSCSCYGRSFLGNKQVGSSVVPGHAEIAAAVTEMGVMGGSITVCQTPSLPSSWKEQAMPAHVERRLWLPSLYQMTGCFFREPVCGFS